MIKRILYFGSPCHISLRNKQLVLRLTEVEKNEEIKQILENKGEKTFPIEDLGMIVIDNQQITITNALLAFLMENNVATVICNNTHHPIGLMLALHSNTLQTERYRDQIEASVPLKKQLWAQIISRKIENQASLLKEIYPGYDQTFLIKQSKEVKSGDSTNREAVAASVYWSQLFQFIPGFVRHREGPSPNHILNYGYAILRAAVARSIVETGLLPTLGLHHHNRYNPYCLADDLMEPYRVWVDRQVYQIVIKYSNPDELTKQIKNELLSVMFADCKINDEISPLQIAIQKTARSLQKCFEGSQRKLQLPVFG